MLRTTSLARATLALLMGLMMAAMGPRPAMAQEPIPNVLPRVVFLIHGGADMAPLYTGTPKSRWDQALISVRSVLVNAMPEFEFAVYATSDAGNLLAIAPF